MKIAVLAAAPILAVSLAHAAEMDCNKGTPWRLPVATPPLKHMEAPIKIDGKALMVMICNCTADAAGKNTGVWLRAYSESASPSSFSTIQATRKMAPLPEAPASGDTQGYYLPGRSCVLAGTATIILAPVDDKVESWGWFAPQP